MQRNIFAFFVDQLRVAGWQVGNNAPHRTIFENIAIANETKGYSERPPTDLSNPPAAVPLDV
jgi:hypothetical protein